MTAQRKENGTTTAELSESLDSAVQRTNDDSVVSKRSAVYHRYIDDSYLRYFVRKLSRRSPLINRGYYLRMMVITDVVERCIHHLGNIKRNAHSIPIQVISLGAGYDTLAFRLKREEEKYTNVHFYEIDFPSVMRSKAELIKAAPKGAFPEDVIAEPNKDLVMLHGKNYHAIGVDLRDTEKDFICKLKEASSDFSPHHPTLLYAECVMQYMPPAASSELIKRVVESFDTAIVVAYDQISPFDSFGEVMQNSLRGKASPLLGLLQFPDGASMIQRAVEQGMKEARFANFHDLSRYYISGDEKQRVEALEPFDETEEWCEMCKHYGITMACTSREIGLPSHPSFLSKEETETLTSTETTTEKSSLLSEGMKISVRSEKWPTGRFGFEGWGNGQAYAEELPSGDVLIISFGGFSATKSHQRINTVYVHSLRDGECKITLADASLAPPPLVFHSFTRIAPGMYVVMGGRTNPGDVKMDAYMLNLDLSLQEQQQIQKPHVVAVWSKLEQVCESGNLPVARYRHAAVAIPMKNNNFNTVEVQQQQEEEEKGNKVCGNIFVFGGRTAEGSLLNDAWMAIVHTGKKIHWKRISLTGDIPPPCCSSAVINLHVDNTVLITGGLVDGDCCEDSAWSVNCITGISQCLPHAVVAPRFSQSMSHVCIDGVERILVLGGSSCHPRGNQQQQEVAVLLDAITGEKVSVLSLPVECPTWTRHCCVTLGEGVVAVLGGGFTCFSFGTFAAKPSLLFLGDHCHCHWQMTNRQAEKTPLSLLQNTSSPLFSFKRAAVEEQRFSKEAFLKLAQHPIKPVVFRKVNMGDCVHLWSDPDYLKKKEGDTTVSVHVARETHLLDFVKKNFSFQHLPFSKLVDHCVKAGAAVEKKPKQQEEKEKDEKEEQEQERNNENEETWYLRAVAANMKSERSNIWKDFPAIGNDFVLPEEIKEYIEPRMHQACFRLSAPPLELWTHYDTLDNVLCQVVGTKRVVIFPPSEYNNLYMNGSSSSVLNINAPDLTRFPRFADACRHAMEVILEPGDMLFLPSLWFHHITTMGNSHCISVNVFFERFPHEDYDKKDLYGNKDLPAAARLRKNIVEKVQDLLSQASTERMSDGKLITQDFVEFALRQAIQDLEELGENMAAARRGRDHL
ncbi:tRNA wybutosine-synthesizing protein 4 [Trypanosoma theileri]|uniref:tRNA wybutosine-synthesizing protein 4 n=1 Tax=Trypanosoma theileri TaxID=67003 RepID=A0A1X0P5M0_9TRYP|nr:tRNA wybutosine-synthesizing protein 4 [Trypanosoma theileri]ORC92175.1 tRNA wybutosine-synthesizing protein 4 [Trypanosoma theileri]